MRRITKSIGKSRSNTSPSTTIPWWKNILNGEKISADELRASIRRSTIALKLVPVLAGSAFKNKGIQPLLDAVVDYLPSPLDVPPVEGTTANDEVVLRRASDDEPFSALAFKIMSDPFVGHVTYIRVYSGVLKAGSYVYNSTKSTRERVGRLLRMHANKREEIDAIYAGDIAACVGLKSVTTGDTLCDEDKAVVLENIEFPAPVISVAIEPKTKADQDKLGNAMQRLAQEDPTFRVHSDPDTGQTIISGMGELHLEIIVDRMMREFGVQATVGRPQVAYRETIRKRPKPKASTSSRPAAAANTATAKSKCFRCLPPRTKTCMKCRPMNSTSLAKEVGGSGGKWRFDKEHRMLFIDKIVGGSIPKEFIAPIDAGIREAMENGILAGYEMVDIAVLLIDGSYHDVDSSEMAFKIAGSMAFKEACGKAHPVLLEPIMKVEVVTPEEYMAQVFGDLNSRRCQIQGTETPRRRERDSRRSSAGRDVRLCHRCAQPHAGPRQLQHAFLALCGSPGVGGRGSDREDRPAGRLASVRDGIEFSAGLQANARAEEQTERWRRKNSSEPSRT